MARRRRIASMAAGELNLTAMIDVAFQMLSFFVITLTPVSVLANMEVNRPTNKPAGEISKSIVHVTVFPNGEYSFNYVKMSRDGLDSTLCDLGRRSNEYTILIECTQQSSHGKMIDVLDICEKAGLKNLSVVSVE